MEKPNYIIEAFELSKSFRRDAEYVHALNGLTLRVREGAFLALMGPSGSGKTTLLNLIAGIDKPTSGTLTVLGEDLAKLGDNAASRWRNRHIGYVFQTFNLVPVLTAFENVELPLLLTGISASERKKHVLAALELVELEDRINHLPKQLSGGQEQRVAIARAIVTDATILLADEPTGDLDRASASQVLTIFKRLNGELGKTIIMVTHDPQAAECADSTQYLEKGELMAAAHEERYS